MRWSCSPPELRPLSVPGVMWFASGDGFFVVSSAGGAGSVVSGCVEGVCVALHVRVEHAAMCII